MPWTLRTAALAIDAVRRWLTRSSGAARFSFPSEQGKDSLVVVLAASMLAAAVVSLRLRVALDLPTLGAQEPGSAGKGESDRA